MRGGGSVRGEEGVCEGRRECVRRREGVGVWSLIIIGMIKINYPVLYRF